MLTPSTGRVCWHASGCMRHPAVRLSGTESARLSDTPTNRPPSHTTKLRAWVNPCNGSTHIHTVSCILFLMRCKASSHTVLAASKPVTSDQTRHLRVGTRVRVCVTACQCSMARLFHTPFSQLLSRLLPAQKVSSSRRPMPPPAL